MQQYVLATSIGNVQEAWKTVESQTHQGCHAMRCQGMQGKVFAATCCRRVSHVHIHWTRQSFGLEPWRNHNFSGQVSTVCFCNRVCGHTITTYQGHTWLLHTFPGAPRREPHCPTTRQTARLHLALGCVPQQPPAAASGPGMWISCAAHTQLSARTTYHVYGDRQSSQDTGHRA